MVPWQGGWLVADNETADRLFRFDAGMRPGGDVALNAVVDDAEALALDAGRLWIVGSQSANKEGKARPARERLGLLHGPAVAPDLSGCPACVAARGRAPNAGGLNVEGAASWGGKLWLGLRAPLEGGRALLLETGADAAHPDVVGVARVVPVALDGMGVREMVPWKEGLLVVAGPVDDAATPHALWWLSTPEATPVRLRVDLPPSTEGFAPLADGTALIVTDGSGKAGRPCEQPATWRKIEVALP